jgi:3-hydroxyisobutyrate dehydrogenase-like beta-hydroxyacid dehydrogenase
MRKLSLLGRKGGKAPIVKCAFALALGIGVELVAEALKFLAGAGVGGKKKANRNDF